MANAEQLITQHIDVWSSSIKTKSSAGRGSNKKIELHGVKKIRTLILGLAIRGLLTPQDGKDEPADKLLARVKIDRQIRAEKGQLKKQKPLRLVNDDSPLTMPHGWTLTRLGNLLDRISNGYSGKQDKSGNGYPLTRIETISDSEINFKKVGFTTDLPEEKKIHYKLIKNDILLSHINSDLHVGKTAIFESQKDLYHGINLLLLRPNPLVSAGYINLWLNQIRLSGYFLTIAQHAIGQSSINQKQIIEIKLPLPPLAEQHRIVAKVDELMGLCDQLEQEQESNLETHETLVSTLLSALTKASLDASQFAEAWKRIEDNFDIIFATENSVDKLKQTILQLAVMGKLVPQDLEKEQIFDSVADKIHASNLETSAPLELPPSWLWSSLNQLADINGGFAFKSGNYNSDGTRVVRISDFDEYGFKPDKIVRHEFSSELEKFRLFEGDILMAMTGGTVGKSFHIKSLNEPMIANQRVATIRASKIITSHFLHIVIQSKGIQEEINKVKNSTNDNISMKQINSFIVPLPPLSEQHRIVAKVDELMSICDQLKASLASAQKTQLNLADSLVEQAIN